MTTSISEIALASIVSKSATREAGRDARNAIVAALQATDRLTVNLDGVRTTPSFADECFGVLVQQMGRDAFQKRIKLTNVPANSRPLLRHVLALRTQARSDWDESRHSRVAAAAE